MDPLMTFLIGLEIGHLLTIWSIWKITNRQGRKK